MKMGTHILELVPSYECNLRCPFCIEWKRYDGTRMDLNILEKQLEILSKEFNFNKIIIIGGEPFQLPKQYLIQLIQLIADKIPYVIPTIFTNFTNLIPEILSMNIRLCVALDPYVRTNTNIALMNLLTLENYDNIRINMILSKELLNDVNIISNILKLYNLQINFSVYNHTNLKYSGITSPDPDDIIKLITWIKHHNLQNRISLPMISQQGRDIYENYLGSVHIDPSNNIFHFFDTMHEDYEKCKNCEQKGICMRLFNDHNCARDKYLIDKISEFGLFI